MSEKKPAAPDEATSAEAILADPANAGVPVEGVYRGPKTLSISPTYTCPAECKDCGTLSSPRDRTNLPLERVLSAIDQAKDLGFFNVVFTGGEPTLRWPDLLTAITHSKTKGLLSRIVTNAHWATSLEASYKRIDALMEAGICEINYSTGDEHARFIPLERVVTACHAAAKRSLKACIMVELRAEREVTERSILDHPMIQELTDEEREYIHTVESPWMPLDPMTEADYPDGVKINRDNVTMCNGCDSVLQTYVVQADGRIGACCGLGMRIIPELNVTRSEGEGFLARAVEEAENDFLKLWIRYKGPEKILAWAAEKDPSIDWENRYGHRCQACLRIYKDPQVGKVIREHYEEMLSDVLQSVWFDEEFVHQQLGGSVKPYRRYSEAPVRIQSPSSAEGSKRVYQGTL